MIAGHEWVMVNMALTDSPLCMQLGNPEGSNHPHAGLALPQVLRPCMTGRRLQRSSICSRQSSPKLLQACWRSLAYRTASCRWVQPSAESLSDLHTQLQQCNRHLPRQAQVLEVTCRQTRKLQAAEEGARIEAEAAYEQSLKATARANTLREVQQQRASLEEMVRPVKVIDPQMGIEYLILSQTTPVSDALTGLKCLLTHTAILGCAGISICSTCR